MIACGRTSPRYLIHFGVLFSLLKMRKDKLEQFNKKNIYTIEDLINYLPRKYYDFTTPKMTKEIKDGDMKTFLLYLRGDDKIKPIAKSITIKTKKRKTKFKLRCPRYVYTLKIDDEKKADKIKTSIPKEITKHEVSEKKGKKKSQQSHK